MHILLIGLNHNTASVALREQVAIHNNSLQAALAKLREMKSILECVIVSTCNRTEMYIVCDQLHTGEYYAKSYLEQWTKVSKDQFVSHLYIKKNLEAVRHLFQVVCGLDSLILGETQILGQIRNAFLFAQSSGTTGIICNRLFRQAITLGKHIHSNTRIGKNAVSISYAAVELAKTIFPCFQDKTVLLIGAGRMSELAAKHFLSRGATRILVINRTYSRAEALAKLCRGEARSQAHMRESLIEADIVVSSTSSPVPILTEALISSVCLCRKLPLLLIDIAVPRDVEPAVQDLEGVFLYNVDDLYGIVDRNKQIRAQEVHKVQVKIMKEEASFKEWIHSLGVLPLICALREKATSIQEETMARMERKLPDLTEQQKRVISKQTKSIVNQLLKEPIVRIKELAATSRKEDAIAMFIHLHALEEQLKKTEEEEKSPKVVFGS